VGFKIPKRLTVLGTTPYSFRCVSNFLSSAPRLSVAFKFTILNSASQFSFLARTLILRYTANLTPMELRSRVLGEVETGDSGPEVPGPSSLVTEGSGEPVPDSAMSRRSITEKAGASLSHPSTAGLMGATLRAPIAGAS